MEVLMRRIVCAFLVAALCAPTAVMAQSTQDTKEVTKDETKLNVDHRIVREDLARGKFKDAENQVKKVDNDKQELNEDQQ
jgi:hypothetical protein